MHILIRRLKTIFPGLNRFEFTEDDCWRFVEKNKILVRRANLEVPAYTGKTKVRGRKRYYILIDARLRGVEFLRVFLHEIGHVVLHEPRGSLEVLYFKHERDIETKQETEADVFMLLAMIPKRRYLELKQMPPDQLHPLTAELLILREKLYEKIME